MIFEILLSTETRDSLFFQPDGDIFSAADVREQLHAYYNGGDETGIYESAAQVDADDLEHVFELTQNLTPSGWLAGDRVVELSPQTAPYLWQRGWPATVSSMARAAASSRRAR